MAEAEALLRDPGVDPDATMREDLTHLKVYAIDSEDTKEVQRYSTCMMFNLLLLCRRFVRTCAVFQYARTRLRSHVMKGTTSATVLYIRWMSASVMSRVTHVHAPDLFGFWHNLIVRISGTIMYRSRVCYFLESILLWSSDAQRLSNMKLWSSYTRHNRYCLAEER